MKGPRLLEGRCFSTQRSSLPDDRLVEVPESKMLQCILFSVLLTMFVQRSSAAGCICDQKQVSDYWAASGLDGSNLADAFNKEDITIKINLVKFGVITRNLTMHTLEIQTTGDTITVPMRITGNFMIQPNECSFGGDSDATVTITTTEENGKCIPNLLTVQAPRVDQDITCLGWM
ncbi:hypothetical protein NDU88_011556 [Pleurodeles waltl]|uniref:Uncharacterized protein n=1 Tax=Pleurodeles waltl TaxID=8319 RepID=A0AAV7S773_PLEWA|nr:hypothetical protein NDU88_011556 [Pleurodeles waltl]